MTPELSTDQRHALDATGTPLELVDPRTGHVYVLVPQESFARVRSQLQDELADSYPAQVESAMRAGWDDPVMDEYNDYDRHHSP